jgi:hypothetical protein
MPLSIHQELDFVPAQHKIIGSEEEEEEEQVN